MQTALVQIESGIEANPTPGLRRGAVVISDWRAGLPVLQGAGVALRELRHSDAPTLFAMLKTEEVARFVSSPPTTLDGFERFIAWCARQQAEGRSLCFGIVPQGYADAVGLIQVRALEPSFSIAEWGFAIGSPFWGHGVFQEGAKMVVDFVIEAVGVHRLEARAAVSNGRGNAALRKLGAVEEGLLRKSFGRSGQYGDQVLWSIVEDDWLQSKDGWLQSKTVWGARIH